MFGWCGRWRHPTATSAADLPGGPRPRSAAQHGKAASERFSAIALQGAAAKVRLGCSECAGSCCSGASGTKGTPLAPDANGSSPVPLPPRLRFLPLNGALLRAALRARALLRRSGRCTAIIRRSRYRHPNFFLSCAVFDLLCLCRGLCRLA
jgi:hypothetical protein